MTQHLRRTLVSALAGVVGAGLLTGTGPALPAAADEAAVAVESVNQGKLMLVLDASGSMAEPAGGGQTRIEAARQALNTTIGGLPGRAQVGMRVYGATVASKAADPAGACKDSQLAVPIGTANGAALKAAVGKYKPFGETPTSYALQQAAKDLGTEGRRSIVLVSDGEANCAPDPCTVAADIAGQGIDLKIDVVGLGVSGKARRQLQCIADSGNGSYYDADDAEDLTAGLGKLSSRAFRPFQFTGTPLTLGGSSTTAPEAKAGQYLTTIGAGGQDRYAVVRKKPGSSLSASVTTRAPYTGQMKASTVDLELSTLEGKRCAGGADSNFDLSDQNSVFTAGVLLDPHTDSSWQDDGCGTADRLLLRVRNGRDSESQSDKNQAALRSELVLIEEPPVPDAAQQQLPPKDEAHLDQDYEPRWAPTGTATKMVGGTSFSDARTLTPGTHADSILPGESLTYRVRLQHGQRAELVTRYATLDAAAQQSLGVLGTDVTLNVFGPTRQLLSTEQVTIGAKTNTIGGVTTPHVRYRNREYIGEELRGASMDGYYYLILQADRHDNPVTLPFELDVEITGTPSGKPAYAAGAVQGPNNGTDDGPDDGSKADRDPAPTENNKNTTTNQAAADDNDLASLALPAGLVLLVVAGVVVAAILLLRRRRTHGPTAPDVGAAWRRP